MKQEIIDKLGLTKTDLNTGKSFIHDISIYKDAKGRIFMRCNGFGEPIDGTTVIGNHKAMVLSDEFLEEEKPIINLVLDALL